MIFISVIIICLKVDFSGSLKCLTTEGVVALMLALSVFQKVFHWLKS